MNITYLCHDESGNINAVISGPSAYTPEPTGSFISYTGEEEVTTDWYIKDGVPVKKPEQPSPNHAFNTETETWEISLDEAKNQAWSRIKKNRDEEEFSTFASNDLVFQSDSNSQQRILSAVQRAQLDETINIEWTLADNSMVTFTGTSFIEVGKDLGEHIAACHLKASSLRAQINEATNQAELDAIMWS